jgi:hypothetical protein
MSRRRRGRGNHRLAVKAGAAAKEGQRGRRRVPEHRRDGTGGKANHAPTPAIAREATLRQTELLARRMFADRLAR